MRSVPTEEAFCDKLRAALRARRAKVSAKNTDLAPACGTSEQTVSGWFTGAGPPMRVGSFYTICLEMGTTPQEIISEALEGS